MTAASPTAILRAPGPNGRREEKRMPYVRVTPFRFDPTREEEVTRLSEERILPALRRLPGFRRYVSGVDRAAGRGVSVSEWDDQTHAQGLREALGGLVGQAEALGVQFEAPQVYEINLQA
jgi:hypothetical protein